MFKTFINIFKVPELRNKVLFTLLMLGIYRIGFWVPLLGVDQQHFVDLQNTQSKGDTAAGRVASYMSLFSGGTLGQSTIFGLGVMPYISASIIFQLLGTVIPSLEKLQKEGEVGRKKIQEWTRYATIPLCVIQAIFFLTYMVNAGLVQRPYMREHAAAFWLTGTLAMTAGSIFLMWLGEQIDEYGLGNGVSLIILAGITARMPGALGLLAKTTNFSTTEDPAKPINLGKIVILVLLFVFIIMGSILITQAQRRIPVQQAKHTRGRRVYGGSKQFLPLRVNHGGVMPIIFAQSLMLFPGVVLGYLDRNVFNGGAVSPGEPPHSQLFVFVARGIQFLNAEFARGQYLYILTELAMIYFFAYFWTTVQFQPKEMANQLRDYGSFIPGLRPGKRTADYLEKVMMRITYVGGAFLCIIAVIPSTINIWLGIDPRITQFLGGTGLLIVVSVALDMVQRIEANLVMRNYSGFLSDGTGRGKRIKGRQY
jgi:preprotein translocase subunit SecY